MGADKREEGAAGRLETVDDRVQGLTRRVIETSMPHAWHEFVLREYGALMVIAAVPEAMWFPPDQEAGLPGLLVARHPGEAVRKLASLDFVQELTNGGR